MRTWNMHFAEIAPLRELIESFDRNRDRDHRFNRLAAAVAKIDRRLSISADAVRPYCGGFNSSGSLAMFAPILRASSFVSSLAADRRPGSFS